MIWHIFWEIGATFIIFKNDIDEKNEKKNTHTFWLTYVQKPILLLNHSLQKGALKRHIECVHEGSKPYGCDLCDKAYTQSQALIEHKVKVHKLLLYKCSLCPEGYPQRKDLIDHLGSDFVF